MFLKTLNKYLRIYLINSVIFLVWLTLSLLIYLVVVVLVKNGDFGTLGTPFGSAIALLAALSSVTFSYAAVKEKGSEEYRKIVDAGEMFFYATLILIIVFILSWLSFEVTYFSQKLLFFNLIKWPLYVVFAAGLSFYVYVASGVSQAIKILENQIWPRIEKKISLTARP
jgi:hypothetical protein